MGRTETRQATQATQEMSTEALITKVCSDFSSRMEAKIDKKLDKMYDKLNDKLNDITKSISSLEERVTSNKTAISHSIRNADITQQYLKRNSIRINGLQEEQEGEAILLNTLNFIKNKLQVDCVEADIDSVFRVGSVDRNKGAPRPILVNFARNIQRSQVFNARKMLKNSRVSIYEDLTKPRFDLLVEAKKKLGAKKAWSAGGKIYIWSEDARRRVEIKEIADLQLY